MLRKLGLALAYFVAIVYIVLIVWPTLYCYQHHWCSGPAELDAFMPAFMLTPWSAVAAAFALRNSIQQIRKRHSWSWAFWPLAIIFAIVVLGAIALIALLVFFTVFHRSH